jgi:hypothetical protein
MIVAVILALHLVVALFKAIPHAALRFAKVFLVIADLCRTEVLNLRLADLNHPASRIEDGRKRKDYP